MGFEAVSDAGPIIHITELDASKAFKIVATCTTSNVEEEIHKHNIKCPFNVFVIDADKTSFFTLKHHIGIGEASCIALATKDKIPFFFTDDLDARIAARAEGLEPHGTIGILLRAFHDGFYKKQEVIARLEHIKDKSSLFITQRLINEAIAAVKTYREQG
jgi:hypothetical protein